MKRSAGGLEELLKSDKKNKDMFDERILGGSSFVEGILQEKEKEEIKKK